MTCVDAGDTPVKEFTDIEMKFPAFLQKQGHASRRIFSAIAVSFGLALAGCSSSTPEVAMSGTSAVDILTGKAIAEGIGIRNETPRINAQPRGELVMPPSADLPEPEEVASNRPEDWPEDPDIKAEQERAAILRDETLSIGEVITALGIPGVRVKRDDGLTDTERQFQQSQRAGNRLTREEMRELTRDRIIRQQKLAATAAGGLDSPPNSHLAVSELDADQARAISVEEVPEGRFGRFFRRRNTATSDETLDDALAPKSTN